jgi:hypothetical protein
VLVCVLGICQPTSAIHIADNGDGTFTNPVMPNAHCKCRVAAACCSTC